MVDDQIKVTGASIKDLSLKLGQSAGRIDAALRDLERKLLVLSRDWTGSASTAYQQAQAAWQRTMMELHEALAVSGQNVDKIHERYTAAGQRIRAIWSAGGPSSV